MSKCCFTRWLDAILRIDPFLQDRVQTAVIYRGDSDNMFSFGLRSGAPTWLVLVLMSRIGRDAKTKEG